MKKLLELRNREKDRGDFYGRGSVRGFGGQGKGKT